MSGETESAIKKKRKYKTFAYPKNSLIDALRIAQAIRDHSAGKPYDRLDLAKTLNTTPASSRFRTLITSSARFGLTTGGYTAKQITLTPLGTSIVYPKGSQERADGLKKALFSISLFSKFFSDYDGNKLPDVEYLTNTLNRTYGIPVEDCIDCYKMIVKNAKELKVLDEIGGAQWIHLSKLSTGEILDTGPQPPSAEEEGTPEAVPSESQPTSITPSVAENPMVFISHSKNETIVEQIKTILEFGQYNCMIAEETETTAIPIPEKVFGLMRQCNCAIINVSADEQEKKDDETYGVNPNVLTEIGGAFLLYEKKVILLVDRRVQLPSNLQGLYRCEYEGDELAFSTYLKLQKALVEFRKNS